MCYASPGTRCSTTALKKLKEAKSILNSVDPNNVEEWLEANDLVRQEEYEYSMSPAGMKELKAKAVATKLQSDNDIYENAKAVRDARNKIARANAAKRKAESAAKEIKEKEKQKAKVEADNKNAARKLSVEKRNKKTLSERDELLSKNNEKLSQSNTYELTNITGREPIATPYYLSAKNSFNSFFDYDYERSSCRCSDDYCRCTTIESGQINDTDAPSKAILASYLSCREEEVPEEYVDYANSKFGLNKVSNYEVTGGPGYYGEEVEVRFQREGELRKYLSDELDAKGLGHSPIDNYSRSNGVEISGKSDRAKVNEILKAAGYKTLPAFKTLEVSPVNIHQLDKDSKELLEHTMEMSRPYVGKDYETIERDAWTSVNGIFLENSDGTYSILGDQAVYKLAAKYRNQPYGIVLKP